MAPTQPQPAAKDGKATAHSEPAAKTIATNNPSGKQESQSEASEPNAGAVKKNTDPFQILSADHRHVEQLFSSYEKSQDTKQKAQIAEQICNELTIHTLLEEEIFYPACQEHMEKRLLDEAQVEHDGTKVLLIEVYQGSPDDEYFDAKVKVLSEEVKHHVQEEEKPGQGIFAMAKKAGIATAELAQQLTARKEQLIKQATAGDLGPPETRSFRAQIQSGDTNSEREVRMARGYSSTMDRERDERGRFVNDDDDRDMRSRSSSRSRDDDDDRGGRGRSSGRSRDDDDGRGRGHGGWFGDSEGHSQAAREGWDDRTRSRSRDDDDDRGGRGHSSSRSRDDEGRFTTSRSRDDDDDRGGRGRSSSRSRDDEGRFSSRSRDDDDGRGHGRGGWFGDPEGHSRASREGWRNSDHDGSGWRGDPEGHSRASREGWRNSDHEGSGWYGDPEGHSRASREGWDDRGRSRSRNDDDDRGRGSSSGMRSRDDEGRFTSSRSRDDDDRGGGGRGHGGWFGDSEGHSRAAREGRDDRGESSTRSRSRNDDDDDRGGNRGRRR